MTQNIDTITESLRKRLEEKGGNLVSVNRSELSITFYDYLGRYIGESKKEHLVEIYNMALEDAADNATAEMRLDNNYDINSGSPVVDQESILSLKIL